MFSNIEVNPRPDETKEGGIVVEIKLKELEPKSAEVSTEWSIVPGREGRPTLVMYLLICKNLFLLESYIQNLDKSYLNKVPLVVNCAVNLISYGYFLSGFHSTWRNCII